MRRIGMGLATGLAIWLGSAVMAEAQSPTIQPTGPLSVTAGSTTSTFTANIYLPTPCVFKVRLWIYNGSTLIHYTDTITPNPGINNPVFTKLAAHGAAPNAGDTLTYVSKLWVAGVWYDAANWVITVSGTRPSKNPSYHQSKALALQSSPTDRRREE